jgi:hypothetical protein
MIILAFLAGALLALAGGWLWLAWYLRRMWG